MVTFTTLAKNFSDNCFCNTKVAGFGEINFYSVKIFAHVVHMLYTHHTLESKLLVHHFQRNCLLYRKH